VKSAKRDTRIEIQRASVSLDALGGETKTWATVARPWAALHYGRGQERRQAAAEQGQQAVTMNILASPLTRTITITDRAVVGGEVWDIVGVAPIGRRDIDLAAVRAP